MFSFYLSNNDVGVKADGLARDLGLLVECPPWGGGGLSKGS